MSKLKPFFIENSKIPLWLSKIAPIEVEAVSFACFVWGRGALSERTKRHETIHYHQQLEMLFVLQWALYALFYVVGRLRYGSWKDAYFLNPFEQEAFDNQEDTNYLKERKLWSWTKYVS
jgi:hypothetical protein